MILANDYNQGVLAAESMLENTGIVVFSFLVPTLTDQYRIPLPHPETMAGTRPYIHHVFSCIYVPMIKFNL
jgi:hypothetical protein